MNMKRKVIEYLDEHPKATTNELRKEFPEASNKSLWNYSGQWKKQKGISDSDGSKSIRRQVFDFLNRNYQASLSDLKKALPDANRVSITNYRYQWMKQKSDVGKKVSVKDQVYSYLDKNPDTTFGELRKALPYINPSSVSAYHSQWKKSNNQKGNSGHRKSLKVNRLTTLLAKSDYTGSDKELVKALQTTIEAQKVTIEAMKTQNSLLKEKQSVVISELEGLNDLQLDEIKRIMITYIKGMRKL